MKACVVKFARKGIHRVERDEGIGCLVGPGLAVAKVPKDWSERGWQVNHLPTGYVILGDFATRRKAVAAARILLEAPVHWERLSEKPSRATSKKVQPYLRRALELSRADVIETSCDGPDGVKTEWRRLP